MTKEDLDLVRERLDVGFPISMLDGALMLAEIERLNNELAMATQVSGELCDKCGWAMKFPNEPCRCELLDGTERKDLLDEIGRLTAERNTARNMLEGICSEFEGVVAHADWKAAGSKGMSVPFRGDFASAVQLPSLVGRMRWWANEMRKVIDGKVE